MKRKIGSKPAERNGTLCTEVFPTVTEPTPMPCAETEPASCQIHASPVKNARIVCAGRSNMNSHMYPVDESYAGVGPGRFGQLPFASPPTGPVSAQPRVGSSIATHTCVVVVVVRVNGT